MRASGAVRAQAAKRGPATAGIPRKPTFSSGMRTWNQAAEDLDGLFRGSSIRFSNNMAINEQLIVLPGRVRVIDLGGRPIPSSD